jgi:hypothetical protein
MSALAFLFFFNRVFNSFDFNEFKRFRYASRSGISLASSSCDGAFSQDLRFFHGAIGHS